ncbi:MAG: bifunctional phosphopantothenoylcysteine decarboxylase/phosphopantothenate--cysteine ligase CoaBC [Fimbriimonadaceae bacterium]|nr:bifunctional phosphopantothenoylcysteine decarboxylase/phosphopantothenate--cysteine ligase CoaBC [Fimbriimonadaceae bacterium]QYK58635.1 MAG: bifunctional phosphopantothenoylcysteine decarboxylase/phosphopantothenate--cysteine ligase CoaBC [Fimbriimonadaceae bacterium]
MANIVLGVTGSVACYRACDLARELMRQGHVVRACLTKAASEFVSPALFEALTQQPCLVGVFDEPEPGRMAHIDWARWADLVVVAPATADAINKLAAGIGDDMLTTLCLATEAPWVLAPAMNPAMYSHPATVDALSTLSARAAWIVEPTEGDVACGEHGQGKLASIAAIVEAIGTLTKRSTRLHGKKVLVTSGPTREPIDDVRFVSNRSSGKMGAALAQAALLMGAEVTVVTGPVSTPLPARARVIRVETAIEMLEGARGSAKHSDLIIGAAAVADYRPIDPTPGKSRRGEGTVTLALTQNPDIIAALAKENPRAVAIAFAAEPGEGIDYARLKLHSKGVRAIAINDVSREDIGFESDFNELVWLTENQEVRSGRLPKLACALWLLEHATGELSALNAH